MAVWPVSIICLSGALSVFKSVGTWPLSIGLGGVIGDAALGKLVPLLSLIYLPPSPKLAALILVGVGLFLLLSAIAVSARDVFALFYIEDLGIKSLIVGTAAFFISLVFEIKGMFGAILHKYETIRLERKRNILKRHNFSRARNREELAFASPEKTAAVEPDREYPKFSIEDENEDEDYDEEDLEEGRTFDLDDPLSAYTDVHLQPEPSSEHFKLKDSTIVKGKRKPAVKPKAKPKPAKKANARFVLPNYRLLDRPAPKKQSAQLTKEILTEKAHLLQEVLSDFGISGSVNNVHAGPVVTLYEFEPARGTKSARVIGLANDIARSMSAVSARVSVIPGRNAIGIELPNDVRETVYLRQIFEMHEFADTEAELPLVLGRTIGGDPVIADLARMPHLLIAGTTGSGKSVGINAMILSLLFRLSPEKCKFIMIDPKMLELSVYDGIPHLLTPVVTDPKKGSSCFEMDCAGDGRTLQNDV